MRYRSLTDLNRWTLLFFLSSTDCSPRGFVRLSPHRIRTNGNYLLAQTVKLFFERHKPWVSSVQFNSSCISFRSDYLRVVAPNAYEGAGTDGVAEAFDVTAISGVTESRERRPLLLESEWATGHAGTLAESR
jgi:hypothetical protein